MTRAGAQVYGKGSCFNVVWRLPGVVAARGRGAKLLPAKCRCRAAPRSLGSAAMPSRGAAGDLRTGRPLWSP